jgi:lipopolysaccharide transport protein LptA
MTTLIKSLNLICLITAWFSMIAPLRAELIEDADDFSSTPIPKPTSPNLETNKEKPEVAFPEDPVPKPMSNPSSVPLRQEPQEAKISSRPRAKNAKLGVVKFWSKSLSGLRNPGSLMLEEDVVVTQDDIRLEADKATIFFEPKSREVREVHAVGSVRFSRVDPDTGQPIKAEGREAIFSNSKRLITMKGEPVMYRGDDVVRGKVIYYDLKNGWVKADRVEGVVQPATKKTGRSK